MISRLSEKRWNLIGEVVGPLIFVLFPLI